jgi:hypothetical protein
VIQELALSRNEPLVGCAKPWLPLSAFRTSTVTLVSSTEKSYTAAERHVEQIRIRKMLVKDRNIDLLELVLRSHGVKVKKA